jgi:hypothetical protein
LFQQPIIFRKLLDEPLLNVNELPSLLISGFVINRTLPCVKVAGLTFKVAIKKKDGAAL